MSSGGGGEFLNMDYSFTSLTPTVSAEMNNVGKKAQLRGFEFAKAVTLVPEPFSAENGLLTPTFKIKRPEAKAYFGKAISDMYLELSKSEQKSQRML